MLLVVSEKKERHLSCIKYIFTYHGGGCLAHLTCLSPASYAFPKYFKMSSFCTSSYFHSTKRRWSAAQICFHRKKADGSFGNRSVIGIGFLHWQHIWSTSWVIESMKSLWFKWPWTAVETCPIWPKRDKKRSFLCEQMADLVLIWQPWHLQQMDCSCS